jgi:hypothetical protein
MLQNEAGQALAMALILMLLGGFLVVPLLDLTTTNLNATRVIDEKTRELYAADAGVEHALWHLQSEDRLSIINPDDTWPMPPYNLGENINSKDVQVTIDHAWLLGGLLNLPESEPPENPPDVVGINANNHWTVLGALNIDVQPRKNYIVDISTSETGTAFVDHIGVWLPQGYSYVTNSVKINGVAIGGLVKNPDPPLPFRGGNVLIWDYWSATTFKSLSDISPPPPGGGVTPSQKFPPSVRLSFDYAVTPFKEARGFFPWINLATGNRIAWDADAGFYHVASVGTTPETGTNTTVEAYVPKGVMRYVSGSSGAASAIQGDYIAIGNSLMTCCWNQTKTGPPPSGGCYTGVCSTCCGPNPYRNYAPAPVTFTGTSYLDAERESYATVNPSGANAVPSDAKIERAYLYWTTWLRGDWLWTERGQVPSWQWNQYMGLDTLWEPNAPQNVKDWLALNAYDGNAYLAVNDVKVTPINAGDPAGTVVADTWYISEGSNNVQPSYQYSCFADVTAQVTAVTDVLPGAKFTVAGVHAHRSTPSTGDCTTNSPSIDWSRSPNAGWSMVIIYSSAQKETHQIYLYRGCQHLFKQAPVEFTMTGFAVPNVPNNEAKMTVFASEGDVNSPPAEYLGFKGQSTGYYQLYDVTNTADVFNSLSSAGGFTPSTMYKCPPTGEISGIDIDTYTSTRPSGGTPLYNIVHPGDTSASIKVESPTSNGEGFEIIYVVFSVRSTAIPAGQEFNVGSMLYRIQ